MSEGQAGRSKVHSTYQRAHSDDREVDSGGQLVVVARGGIELNDLVLVEDRVVLKLDDPVHSK